MIPRHKMAKTIAASTRRLLLAAAGSLLLVVCALAWRAHGEPFPQPGGKFAVGVTSTLPSLLPVPGPPLRLELPRAAPVVDLWYPTESTVTGATRGAAAWLGFGDPRHGLVNAPLASSTRQWPVLLYLPGWEGTRPDNVLLIRELASRGFVIAAIRYPAPGQLSAQAQEQLLAQLRRPMDFSSPGAAAEALDRADERVRERAEDAIATLDRLAELNAADPAGRLTGRIDVQRVGILGFSLGGAVAAETCRRDRRCAAAVNLDGWLFCDAALDGIDQPYLLATGGYSLPGVAELDSRDPWVRLPAEYTTLDESRSTVNFERHGGYLLLINGAAHESFTDTALRTGLRRLLSHEPSPRRTATTVNAYVLAFFRKTLLGENPALLQPGHPTAPGIELRSWPSPE
jgi:dienelactone hydrolase